MCQVSRHFNPRPPWGGRRFLVVDEYCSIQYFNPRPPWGGRPSKGFRFGTSTAFQSTPSVGRATTQSVKHEVHKTISIHALRGEGDGGLTAARGSIVPFQSTPSVGRATECRANLVERYLISIHALRGEGDNIGHLLNAVLEHFNPRPPWGGRPRPMSKRRSSPAFQSTPSVGRATKSSPRSDREPQISIHALRGEGDCVPFLSDSLLRHFNPRPPWGGRLKSIISRLRESVISIHALRGEGDAISEPFLKYFSTFQSTPSVGRATLMAQKPIKLFFHFNPRPPWGGRPNKPHYRRDCIVISIHALRGEGDWTTDFAIIEKRNFNPRPPWGGRR